MTALAEHLIDVDPANPPTLSLYGEFLQSSADLIFVVEGQELPCHRRVLAAESNVFADMLKSVTAKKGEPVRIEEPFKDVPLADMKAVLNAIYKQSRQTYAASSPQTTPLLELAHRFDMPSLSAHIRKQLLGDPGTWENRKTTTVSVDAAFVWLRFCQQFDLEQSDARAARACELVIAANFLQLGRSRREDLQSLTTACLLRIGEAYAKACHKLYCDYRGGSHTWGNLTEDSARTLDNRLTIPFNFFHGDASIAQV